ncbi:MAG: hypothetical protein EOO73_15305 [Myxococcales bacterium]|nr:MAG: hypothetical protein EOO73_15305 [Myxococcales bacterium]
MSWAVGACSFALLLLVVVALWPLRLDVSGKARGNPDGSWVVAGGVTLGVVGAAFVWARGLSPHVSVLVFGQKLLWKPQWTGNWKTRATRPIPARVKAASARLWSRMDPLALGLKLLDERRHVRLRYLVVDLAYGFRDPLLTGRLVGALSVLSAVLPPPVEIRQAPRWDFEDGWDVGVDARAVLRPWLVALDILIYVVRQLSHERHQDRGRRPEPAPGGAGDLQERDDRGGAAAGR